MQRDKLLNYLLYGIVAAPLVAALGIAISYQLTLKTLNNIAGIAVVLILFAEVIFVFVLVVLADLKGKNNYFAERDIAQVSDIGYWFYIGVALVIAIGIIIGWYVWNVQISALNTCAKPCTILNSFRR